MFGRKPIEVVLTPNSNVCMQPFRFLSSCRGAFGDDKHWYVHAVSVLMLLLLLLCGASGCLACSCFVDVGLLLSVNVCIIYRKQCLLVEAGRQFIVIIL